MVEKKNGVSANPINHHFNTGKLSPSCASYTPLQNSNTIGNHLTHYKLMAIQFKLWGVGSFQPDIALFIDELQQPKG